jgi:beta-1,4-mannosyl-glycoprotein beta-1,4-N-acetylglucosaminyltransferase
MLYDCFTFFNELEILDIRLHEMAPIVDRFVLVEARKTFQGTDKPLYFEENKGLFAPYLGKIEHIVVDFPPEIDYLRPAKSPAWAREYFQRDQIAQGLTTARPEDLILISDVDEIVKAPILEKACSRLRRGEMAVFTGYSYAHYLNRQVSNQIWELGPRLCHFKDFRSAQKIRNIKLHASRSLRNTPLGRWHTRLKNWVDCHFSGPLIEYENAIWHFTSLGGWERFRAKIDAFAHEEERDNAPYQSEAAFLDHISTSSHRVALDELPEIVRVKQSALAQHLDLPEPH